jgi:hypothetical protein
MSPSTPGRTFTAVPDVHNDVVADLVRYGYDRLTPMVRAHRVHITRSGPRNLSWTDPIEDAAHHLAAALIHLRRAIDENVTGARLTYNAVLAVAGGLARRFPATIPGQRQGDGR